MATRRTKKVLSLALTSLEEIQRDAWSIREECGQADCVICPRKREAQQRAREAIAALRKELKS